MESNFRELWRYSQSLRRLEFKGLLLRLRNWNNIKKERRKEGREEGRKERHWEGRGGEGKERENNKIQYSENVSASPVPPGAENVSWLVSNSALWQWFPNPLLSAGFTLWNLGTSLWNIFSLFKKRKKCLYFHLRSSLSLLPAYRNLALLSIWTVCLFGSDFVVYFLVKFS